MRPIHTSHDAYFKQMFGDPALAADVLRRLLPPSLVAAMDWDQLEQVPAEFIDEELNAHRADLVFRVPLRGQTAFVFVLYEHQSTIDPMMPLRVLVYMVGIWKTWRREHPDARHLPPIVPVVLYHGERPWSAPTAFHDLFALAPAQLDTLGRFLPAFEVLLDDLARTDDDAIEAGTRRALATVALMMLKHAAHDPDLTPVIERLARHFMAAANEPGGLEALVSTLYYVYSNSDLDPGVVERLIAPHLDPAQREVIVSTAEKLYRKGFSQGIEQGIERGLGRGEVSMLQKALTYKFGALPTTLTERIAEADAAQRERWLQRAFEARSLAEVFAD